MRVSLSEVDVPTIDRALLLKLSTRRSILAASLALLNTSVYIAISLVGLTSGTPWLVLLLWPVQGLILCGVYNMMHDCVHGSFAKTAGVNEIVGSILAAAAMLNYSAYRCFHLRHHQSTRAGHDDENLLRFSGFRQYLFYLPLLPFFIGFARISCSALCGIYPGFVTGAKAQRRTTRDSWVQLAWLTLTITCAIHSFRTVLFLYLGPLIFYFPLMGFTGLPEHYGAPAARGSLLNTRSIDSNALFQLFFWFNNFHVEHHSFPRVPAYNLVGVRRAIENQITHREQSYLAFHLRLIKSLLTHRAATFAVAERSAQLIVAPGLQRQGAPIRETPKADEVQPQTWNLPPST